MPYEFMDGIETEREVVDAYGKLYNCYAVNDARGLCPVNWRVPTDEDFTMLMDYVRRKGFSNDSVLQGAGNTLKSCRQIDSPLPGACSTSEHPR